MHLMRMNLGGIPPFTEPIQLKFDERVNLFIGPNASGKTTVLLVLSDCLVGPEEYAKRPISQGRAHLRAGLYTEEEFEEIITEYSKHRLSTNVLTASEDWLGTRNEPKYNQQNPPTVRIGSVREDLPGISDQEEPHAFGDTASEALDGPFSGPRTMCASRLLGEEVWQSDHDEPPYLKRASLRKATELADACSKRICEEVIRDSVTRNYIPGPHILGYLHHPQADPNRITILRQLGINTTDARNYDNLPYGEQPSVSAYSDYDEPLPIYLGHLSSGTEGTLLWIRWLALKMVSHYGFERDWASKPAILLIDEIENHLHPTWQRRVIPALLEHFPGLQIFATTHSPFVVAGLKAGQVHLLKRDENGVVTATTNTEDIIGWTADEILRTMMGVDEPTDQLTVDRANRLRELREKDTLTTEEQDELNTLRRQVNQTFLNKSSPLEAQRERYSELMQQFLLSRQSDLSRDGG